ncbi:MAG: FixH family protein [Gammaproteobacteria bacterium]|jgi:hypothetical protein
MIEKPWYRQFWPWLLIAIPLTGIAMGLISLVIAIEARDEVVAQPIEPLTRTSHDEQSWDD